MIDSRVGKAQIPNEPRIVLNSSRIEHKMWSKNVGELHNDTVSECLFKDTTTESN